ncbi:MAG: DUF4357 domain-containing protein [Desulfatiglandaceae bacterium]
MLPDEIVEHIRVLDRWIEQLGQTSKPLPGLSVEERKQLQAVNKAIEQLQRTGVPVPKELRSLKLELSAKDVAGFQDQETGEHLKEVEELIHGLGKTIRAARLVQNKLKPTRQGGGPKRYFGVKLVDLIRAGLVTTDDRLELQWMKDGSVIKGKLTADGRVMVKTSEGWQSYASLSTAASRSAGRSLNGWDHWRRINQDGTATTLADIRAQHLNEEANG